MEPTKKILSLKEKITKTERFLSLDQAKIITRVYQDNQDKPVIIRRALSLAQSLHEMPLEIDPEEIIVGNRAPGIRAGVVFPEAGISWIADELETLSSRPQDPFNVRKEDASYFKNSIEPYWKGRTLEDDIYGSYGEEIKALENVVKINQKDHAQGHICPDVESWLKYGPSGLKKITSEKLRRAPDNAGTFYEAVSITLDAACDLMKRYSSMASGMADMEHDLLMRENLYEISRICNNLSFRPPLGFREAVQSSWFLFVILQMESNASSFSPGRMDQYLYEYYLYDIEIGKSIQEDFLEIIDALYIKFNQIVYMRNANSARYFAGFPIGFNITIGGQTSDGKDAANELTYLFLKAQDHVRMPQPNLTARLHRNSAGSYIDECSKIIGLGTGMPQVANDESIIPSLRNAGISNCDSFDYVLVGCVELSPQGNFLGWSDAAMFNLVKVLELTLNDGKCMMSGRQMGLNTGTLASYGSFNDLENAFRTQIDFFIGRMIKACGIVEKAHQEHLPSPFLSSVIKGCLEKGIDLTAGGAKYNYSGLQAIQAANLADSLAVLKKLVYEEEVISREELLNALRNNFEGNEQLRQRCLNQAPKYGNDVEWVDRLGEKWISYFAGRLKDYVNHRGGPYQMGLYTVSAHVPMGQNVAATPDGRMSGTPLADGGLSPMYGRDKNGPTAVLRSVSRIPSYIAGNGTLLNMKFLPEIFKTEPKKKNFSAFLKGFVNLPVHHIQFNVINTDDLIKAKNDPDSYRGLIVRVAGYSAYFTELAPDLQDEIISRTSHNW